MALSILNINSAVVISVVVESSRCSSKHFQKYHVHMRLWTRLYGMEWTRDAWDALILICGPPCPLTELDNPQLVTYLTNCQF